jgi:hypothetical protein
MRPEEEEEEEEEAGGWAVYISTDYSATLSLGTRGRRRHGLLLLVY